MAAEVDATMAVQPADVGLAVGSHLYSKWDATPADGRSFQSSTIDLPDAVAVKPVGRQGPLVLPACAGGVVVVKPALTPRNQTV